MARPRSRCPERASTTCFQSTAGAVVEASCSSCHLVCHVTEVDTPPATLRSSIPPSSLSSPLHPIHMYLMRSGEARLFTLSQPREKISEFTSYFAQRLALYIRIFSVSQPGTLCRQEALRDITTCPFGATDTATGTGFSVSRTRHPTGIPIHCAFQKKRAQCSRPSLRQRVVA